VPHDMSTDPTGLLAWLALAVAYAVAVRAVRREPTDLRAADEPTLRLIRRPPGATAAHPGFGSAQPTGPA
jgi:hypothetical protein